MFLAHQLKVIQEAFFAIREESGHGTKCLRTELWKSITILLPPIDEQEAICSFVMSQTGKIDSLIAKVQEAIDKLREYRTALISAAVTGKIDVSSEAVAVAEQTPGPVTSAAKPANAFFRRTVFAAEIIDRLCDEPTFGHVKFQKCLFVAQHHLRVGDFEESYKRMAAGPYDNRLVRSVDSQLEKSRWFKAEKTGDRYAYRRLDKAGGHRQYFERYFGEQVEPLARLLDLFRPMTTDQAEIVATLYAVWNDFLLRGEPCDDDRIVAEVLTNWHDRKKRFEDDRWRRALGWMRENGLFPTGFGTPTVPGDGGTA
jgi:type I restriction enzyme S subunit/type I restriction enzyme M protein